jgi:hypothetical protein
VRSAAKQYAFTMKREDGLWRVNKIDKNKQFITAADTILMDALVHRRREMLCDLIALRYLAADPAYNVRHYELYKE